MEADSGGFSIREYTRSIRDVEVGKCWPFSGGEVTGAFINSILPPMTVVKFRSWSHELASLRAKSQVVTTADDDNSGPSLSLKRKAKAKKSKPCKKRSIVEILAREPQIQLAQKEDGSGVLTTSKRKTSKDFVVPKTVKSKKFKDSGDWKITNQVNKRKEQARDKVDDDGKGSFGIKKAGVGSKDEFQNHRISKAKRKVCSVTSLDKSSRGCAPQCERNVSEIISEVMPRLFSVEFCCWQLNHLSLSQLYP